MHGNVHVRFGVGVRARFPGLHHVRVEPRSNNAIAAGLSSFGTPDALTHHQGFDLARRPEIAKPTHTKLRPKDRPLANDFVSDDEFDKLLHAWFGNIARVLLPGRAFFIWGGYANCGNYPPVLKACELYFSQAIIWVKEHPVLTRKDFMGNHEWCFYGWREGAAHPRLDVDDAQRALGVRVPTGDGALDRLHRARQAADADGRGRARRVGGHLRGVRIGAHWPAGGAAVRDEREAAGRFVAAEVSGRCQAESLSRLRALCGTVARLAAIAVQKSA